MANRTLRRILEYSAGSTRVLCGKYSSLPRTIFRALPARPPPQDARFPPQQGRAGSKFPNRKKTSGRHCGTLRLARVSSLKPPRCASRSAFLPHNHCSENNQSHTQGFYPKNSIRERRSIAVGGSAPYGHGAWFGAKRRFARQRSRVLRAHTRVLLLFSVLVRQPHVCRNAV